MSVFPVTAHELGTQQNSLNLVEQGRQDYNEGQYPDAIRHWRQALSKVPNDSPDKIIILENLAIAYQQIGQSYQALDAWQQITQFQQQKKIETYRSLTEQAQLYRHIGQPQQAIAILCGSNSDICSPDSAIEQSKKQQDSAAFIAALGTLGEAYRQTGDYDRAIAVLNTFPSDLPDQSKAKILNSLANIFFNRADQWQQRALSANARNASDLYKQFQLQAKQDYQTAFRNYQATLTLSTDNPELQSQAYLNLLRLNSKQFQSFNLDQPHQWSENLQAILPILPENATKQLTRIALATLPAATTPSLPENQCISERLVSDRQALSLLEKAAQVAHRIGDLRSQAYALGELGHFYECQSKLSKAREVTQQALWLAEQNRQGLDNLYLWEWQLGRIYHAQKHPTQALAAYQRAYTLLEQIRSDLLKSDRDLQYNFRDTLDPFYRGFAALQLEQVKPETSQPHSLGITNTIQTIDSLKLAELQNYLGKDCIVFDQDLAPGNNVLSRLDSQAINRQLQQLPEQSALILPIIFEQKTAILLNYKDSGGLVQQIHWLNIPQKTLKQKLTDFHWQLQRPYEPTGQHLDLAQEIHQWLIDPFEAQLQAADTQTLVFIQDGLFRNIPMGALYDGKKFLVQKYAIAVLPSVNFPLEQNRQENTLNVLGVGNDQQSTINNETFSSLPNVKPELEFLSTLFSNSEILLNHQFTRTQLQAELRRKDYNVLHIATHGQFGTIPEDTFLVTGQNQKLTITDLETDLRQYRQQQAPLELLVLTACQTATGDDRTTLGLAGISVQSGAQSTVASLWAIQDRASQVLMQSFYQNLNTQRSKAEALQQAQIDLINQGEHPAIWSPYILVGDWT